MATIVTKINELLASLPEKGVTCEIKGLYPQSARWEALLHAIEMRDYRAVRCLVAPHDVETDINNENALIFAVERGSAEIVSYLNEAEVSHDCRAQALCKAAMCGHLDVVKAFEGLVDFGVYGNEPIRNAILAGHLELVKYLMDKPSVNAGACNGHAIKIVASRAFSTNTTPGIDAMHEYLVSREYLADDYRLF